MQPQPTNQPRRYSRRQLLKALLLVGSAAATTRFSRGLALPEAAALAADPPALTDRGSKQRQPPAQFSGDLALQHAAAQMQWIPRHPGTEGNRLCGDYILAQLAAQGWTTEQQPFVYRETACRNLIGKRGSGPLLIIGAHYDTRRYADEDPVLANKQLPVPGANDGASGIGVLLELARVLRPEDLGRTIWLVAFDAEDNGRIDGWDWIVGSRYMADNLTELPQGMVLVDMIGDADQQIYYEINSTDTLRQPIWQVAADLNYNTFIPQLKWSILDDHIPFLEKGIPAVNLIDFDYPYWHTVQDTLDKISAASLEAVGRTLENWLQRGAPGLPPPENASTHTLYVPALFASFDNIQPGDDRLWRI